jgi:hypothetical protein
VTLAPWRKRHHQIRTVEPQEKSKDELAKLGETDNRQRAMFRKSVRQHRCAENGLQAQE